MVRIWLKRGAVNRHGEFMPQLWVRTLGCTSRECWPVRDETMPITAGTFEIETSHNTISKKDGIEY